jgi:hypothetical protein
MVPNEPEPAARKRAKPTDRRNAQDDHEGSPHQPEEFDQYNPTTQVPRDEADKEPPSRD